HMMNRFGSNFSIAGLVVGLLLVGGAAQPMAAQATLQNSTIFGSVTDASGAAMPGALVEVTSPSLQATQAATTDNEGAYRITNLPAGIYRISYTMQGFQTDVRTDFTLTAGFAARVDVVLKLGAIE